MTAFPDNDIGGHSSHRLPISASASSAHVIERVQKNVLIPVCCARRIMLDIVGMSCSAWGVVADGGRSQVTCGEGKYAGWEDTRWKTG